MPRERRTAAALATVVISLLALSASARAKIVVETFPGGIAGIRSASTMRSYVRSRLGAPSRTMFRDPRCPHSPTDDLYDSNPLQLDIAFYSEHSEQCIPPKYAKYELVRYVATKSSGQKTERGVAVGSTKTELLRAYYRGHGGDCKAGAKMCAVRTSSGSCESDDEYVETDFFLRRVSGTTKVARIRQFDTDCSYYY